MKKINTFIILTFLMLIGMSSFAQNKISSSELSGEWTLLKSADGIEMYIQSSDCKMGNVKEAFEYGMLKIVNTTNSEKMVVFNIETYYTDGCVGCDRNENEYTAIVVPANTTKTGDCENGISILIKNPLQLAYTDFQYLQLTIFNVK